MGLKEPETWKNNTCGLPTAKGLLGTFHEHCLDKNNNEFPFTSKRNPITERLEAIHSHHPLAGMVVSLTLTWALQNHPRRAMEAPEKL